MLSRARTGLVIAAAFTLIALVSLTLFAAFNSGSSNPLAISKDGQVVRYYESELFAPEPADAVFLAVAGALMGMAARRKSKTRD